MQVEVPNSEAPLDASWTAPLDIVANAVCGDPRYQFFDVRDFMIMGKIVRASRPDIIEYKHVHTRAYLHLDAAAGAYRYIPPSDFAKSDGRYVLHRSLGAALDDLGTWQLPWMKPGLEKYRFGYEWDERWMLHPDTIMESLNPRLADDWEPDPDEIDVCAEMYRAQARRENAARPKLSLLPPAN